MAVKKSLCETGRADWRRAPLVGPEPPAVLVIEDDPDLAQTLAEALAGRGYRAASVRDGRDVIEDPERVIAGVGPVSRVDVVVTDLFMPRSSGIDVLEHARARDWAVPIVVMTAFASDELETQALHLGASAVFEKPFALEELLTLVDSIAPLD
jgi:DNA-binding response OmpR family regulator